MSIGQHRPPLWVAVLVDARLPPGASDGLLDAVRSFAGRVGTGSETWTKRGCRVAHSKGENRAQGFLESGAIQVFERKVGADPGVGQAGTPERLVSEDRADQRWDSGAEAGRQGARAAVHLPARHRGSTASWSTAPTTVTAGLPGSRCACNRPQPALIRARTPRRWLTSVIIETIWAGSRTGMLPNPKNTGGSSAASQFRSAGSSPVSPSARRSSSSMVRKPTSGRRGPQSRLGTSSGS